MRINFFNTKIRLFSMFIAGTALAFSFQNCGIQRPGVDVGSFAQVGGMSAASFDPTAAITVDVKVPQYYDMKTKAVGIGESSIVKIVNSSSKSINMIMNHTAAEVSSFVSNCSLCHQSSKTTGIEFSNARFHESLFNNKISQPSSCLECHSSSWVANPTGVNSGDPNLNAVPLGFVGTHQSSYFTDTGVNVPVMMHDALVWSLDPVTQVPKRSKTPVIPSTLDCGVCHKIPSSNLQLVTDSWKGAKFHTSLTAHVVANGSNSITEVSSCLDCHISDRPVTFNKTSNTFADLVVGPATGAASSFGHMKDASREVYNVVNQNKSTSSFKPGMLDCKNCHSLKGSPGSQGWSDGRFHTGSGKPGAFLPTSSNNTQALAQCSTCHTNRPTAWTGGVSQLPFSDSHGKNYQGSLFTKTGGGTQSLSNDCSQCHFPSNSKAASGMMPMWTETQSFHQQIPSDKRNIFSSYGSCLGCHDSQTKNVYFTLNADGSGTKVTASTPGAINHAAISPYNNSECTNCHTGVIKSNFSSLSDWAGAMVMSNTGFVSKTIQYSNGTATPVSGQVLFEMNHSASLFSLSAYTALVDGTSGLKCSACHNNTSNPADAVSSALYVGQFHWTLQNLNLPQPTGGCTDCHGTSSVPQQQLFGKKVDHNALVTRAGTSGTVLVSAIDCSACHVNLTTQVKHTMANPTADSKAFASGSFHAGLGSTYTAGACTQCHASDKPAALASRKNNATYKTLVNGQKFTHSLSSADCGVCHTGGLFGVTSWYGDNGQATVSFHDNQITETNCVACHVAPTGSVSDGVTTYTHGTSDTACENCHSATVTAVAKTTATSRAAALWSGAAGRPHALSGPTSGTNCVDCHGMNKSATNRLNVAESSHFGGVTNGNSCISCHKDYTAFKGSIAYLNYAHSNATANAGGCVTCHAFVGGGYTALTPTAKFNKSTTTVFLQSTSVTASFDGTSFTSNHANLPKMQNCGACHSYSGTTAATTNIWQWKHNVKNPGIANSKNSNGCNMCH